MTWEDDEHNLRLLGELREAIADNGRVLVFLGAGVSFGAARRGQRGAFDTGAWVFEAIERSRDKKLREKRPPGRVGKPPPPRPPTMRVLSRDDGQPLPSWKLLISRMRRELAYERPPHEQDELNAFFEDQDYLDCAQLFRRLVGEPVYFTFLRKQFAPEGGFHITPTHDELVALGLPVLFTTNYDTLIEQAHSQAAVHLTTSSDEREFRAHLSSKSERHLVKLHGTIERTTTIVLTRDDYARSRLARREMFASLRHDLLNTSFLFVGFSLTDPNINIILDDVRVALDGDVPISYSLQAGRNWVKGEYLASLGVRTVWIDSWGNMPSVLRRINPALPVG
jgi:hypothetical protein